MQVVQREPTKLMLILQGFPFTKSYWGREVTRFTNMDGCLEANMLTKAISSVPHQDEV